MSKTLVSAKQTGKNELAMLVDSDYAESFYKYLKEAGVDCDFPSQAIFRTGRIFLDASGRRHVEVEAIVHEITARGTLKDFAKWVEKWVLPSGMR